MKQRFYPIRNPSKTKGFHKSVTMRNKGYEPKESRLVVAAAIQMAENRERIRQTDKITQSIMENLDITMRDTLSVLPAPQNHIPIIIAAMDNRADMLALSAICHQHHVPVLWVNKEDAAWDGNNTEKFSENLARLVSSVPHFQHGLLVLRFPGVDGMTATGR